MADEITPTTPEPGMHVYGSDAERIGNITSIDDGFLVVNTGFMRDDLYVPESVVSRVDTGRVVLTLTKEEVEAKEWIAPSTGGTLTVSGQPAGNRPDAINEVSTTATPGPDEVVDVDSDHFTDRQDMDIDRTE